MDENLKKQIIDELICYEKSIEETDEHYDDLKEYREIDASGTHYHSKHTLPHMIRLLEEEGVDCTAFHAEYTRITRKLTALEEKRGRDYREKLFRTLQQEVDSRYPTMLCFFADMEPFYLEIPNDQAFRDDVEILLMELERDFDLTEIKAKVAILDEVLKCTYIREIKEIIKISDYYGNTEDRSYPDRFWWEHPLKMLQEKKAITGEMYGDDSRFTHYDDHHREWSPVLDQEEYQQKAVTLINRRDRGVELYYQTGYDALIVYDRNANEVACGTQDGLIAAFFRPRTQPTHEIDDEIAGKLTKLN